MKRKILLTAILVFTFLLSACGLQQPAKNTGLSTIKSLADLQEKLGKNYYSGNDIIVFGTDMAPSYKEENTNGNVVETDYTKTNVQVEGVDEGDVVKTDGSRIYSIYSNRLRVIEVNQGNMEIIFEEDINQEIKQDLIDGDRYYSYRYYSDLYLTEEYLIAIFMDYRSIYTYETDANEIQDFYGNITQVNIYDKETLEIVKDYEISGSLNTSRLIDDQLYVISLYNPYYQPANDPRPWYGIDGVREFVDFEDIKYIENTNYNAYSLMTRINLKSEISIDYDCLLGPSYWEKTYVNKNAIYYTTYQYYPNIFGLHQSRSLLVSYIFAPDGSVYYGGSGRFDGYVVDQFSMDEYDGYMRLVTTEGWGDNAINRLYVFERQVINEKYELVMVGKIDQGLGKIGEKVKSARFNKDQATVVTFLETDPLYVIDLSNPTNPVIMGQLEIPGFSTYQHPWDEGLIVGLGYQTVNGRITGLKLSLFDITDPTNPLEVGDPLVIDDQNWGYSEALYNHKALLIDRTRNTIGFSITRANWGYSNYSTLNDYLLFKVDPTSTKPISVAKTINHYILAKEPIVSKDYAHYFYFNSYAIIRAIRIGDYLYAISGSLVSSHHLGGEITDTGVLNLN